MNTFRAKTVATVTVSGAEHPQLLGGLDELLAEYGAADDPRLLHEAVPLGRALLPQHVLQALSDMRYLESTAALVVRNGPVAAQDAGPTPAHWRDRRADASSHHDLWLVLIAAQLGDPVCWSTLQGGRLFNDILPIAGEEGQQTGHGSEAELEFHVEDAFHDSRCDALALLCLRNDDEVPTTIGSAGALDMSTLDTEPLFEPRFRILPDPEHLRGDPVKDPDAAGVRVPVLFGPRDAPYLRVDPAYTVPDPDDHVACRAFDALCAGLAAGMVDVPLAKGDVLLVDNYRAVHGRRPFRPRYDGTDRWLRKCTVVRDARAHRRQRGGALGRVLAPF